MANASGVRYGKVYVEIGADQSPFIRAIKAVETRARAIGATLASVGTQMTAVSAGMLAPFAASAKTFANFEQNMARVKALTGATGPAFNELAELAQKLGRDTVFSASQAAEAMGNFALAGFKVNDIMTATPSALKLAAAGQMGVAQAADISAKIMAGMGLSAEQLGGAVDVLAKAMTTANTDLVQLGDAMKYVGPIAKTAGLSFEETVAAVQALSNAGIQADMAGTTLRGALLSMTAPSAEAAKKLKQLGVVVNDAGGNVRPLADILDALNAGLAGLGSGERLGELGKIFGDRQAAGMAELLSQGGGKLRSMTAALQDAAGTADRISGTQLDTLGGAFTLIASSVEGLAIAVGDALNKPLRVLAETIKNTINVTTQWISEHRGLVVAVAAGAATIGTLGVSLIAAGGALRLFAGALWLVRTAATAVPVTLGLVKAAVVLLTTPIGLATLAVAGLGVAFVAAQGKGDTFLKRLGSGFRETFGGAAEVIHQMVDLLSAGELGAAAAVGMAGLQSAVATAMVPITETWRGFVGGLVSVWIDAMASLKTAWNDWSAWMYKHFPQTTSALAKGWAYFVASIRMGSEQYVHALTMAQLKAMGADKETLQLARDEHAARQAGIRADRAGAIGDANRFATMTPMQLAAENAKVKTEIEQQRQASHAELDKATADAVEKASQAAKDAAAALRAAQDAPFASFVQRTGADNPMTAFAMRGAAAAVAAVTPEVVAEASRAAERASLSFESSGTFNPRAARQIGSVGIAAMLREQQKSNEYLKNVSDAAKNNKLVFAE